MQESITIETDFISHTGEKPCRDLSCPCHEEPYISLQIGHGVQVVFFRGPQSITLMTSSARVSLSHEETYRLLSLLEAEFKGV